MSEGPNERSTLLAKHKRDFNYNNSTDSTESLSSNCSRSSDNSTYSRYPRYSDSPECSCSFIRLYFIEPLILILLFAYNLSSTVVKNQIIFQTCTSIFNFNETDCALLGDKNMSDHTKQIETNVQPYASTIFMTMFLVQSMVPALFGVFIGAWSDRFGRKPLLTISFMGYALQYTSWTIIASFNQQTPTSPWYYVLAGLPNALFGGGVTYSIASLCFISDVSTSEERTCRLILYEAAIYMGLMIGSFTSGYIYEAYGSIIIFSTSAGAVIFALFFIVLFVPESLHIRERRLSFDDRNRDHTTSTYNMQEHSTFTLNSNFALLKEMWSTCFMRREASDRAILWLTIAAMLTTAFVVDGSMTVFYLFIREKFHWTVKQFTTYETFSILAPILGNIFGILVLRKILKLSVTTLAFLAFFSQSVCSFIKGFAVVDGQIYLAVAFGVFKALVNPMCRIIITNLIPANELGKIFSLQSVIQSLITFLASPVYTLVYTLTIKTFAGFFNVLSAHLFLLAIGFFLVILRKKRSQPERYEAILK